MQLPKYLLPVFILPLFFSCSPRYAYNSKTKSYAEYYSLDQLPSGWLKKPKTLSTIDDILPVAIKQLKDRRSCINCKAGFNITVKLDTLYLDDQVPEIEVGIDGKRVGNYLYTTSFRFSSHFSITDSTGQELARMIITDPEEDNYILYKASGFRMQKSIRIPVIHNGKLLGGGPDHYNAETSTTNYGILLNDNLLLDYTADKLKTIRSRIRKFEASGKSRVI